MKLLCLAALAVALPFTAHGEVTVSAPWARAKALASRPAAAYLTLVSDDDDRLIEASTPVAGEIMVHTAETDETGVSRMKHVARVDLPAGETVTFAAGDMHLMLTSLSDRLVEGATFPLTLRFEAAGEVTLDVPILSVGASGPKGSQR